MESRGVQMIRHAPFVGDVEHIATPKESDLHRVSLCIVYNMLYSVTLVAEITDAVQFAESFPEFRLVHMNDKDATASTRDIELVAAFKQHFDKVSFPSYEDAVVKFDAFKQLYNFSKKSEKERIRDHIAKQFDVSDIPEKRMKANDLYKELINVMCVPYSDASSFKKRVAGYLVEFRLQKKRYSDAYYYFGIERKAVAATTTITELENIREVERKDYFSVFKPTPTLAELQKIRDFETSGAYDGMAPAHEAAL
jgi:hypothetical protein